MFQEAFIDIIFLLVPKIVKTAPSPSSEQPPAIKSGENGKTKEFSQKESVL